jgi:hypothetical protein
VILVISFCLNCCLQLLTGNDKSSFPFTNECSMCASAISH